MAAGKKAQTAKGDVTGAQRVKAQAEVIEAQKERAKEVAMATVQAEKDLSKTVDYTGGQPVVVDENDKTVAKVVAENKSDDEAVVVGEQTLKVKAMFDAANITVGVWSGSIEAGRKYILPKHVAEHLGRVEYVEILD